MRTVFQAVGMDVYKNVNSLFPVLDLAGVGLCFFIVVDAHQEEVAFVFT